MRIRVQETSILDSMFRESPTVTDKKEFLPKDPAKALFEVKELLYERLDILRQCASIHTDDDFNIAFNIEINFLQNVLDLIERS